MTTTRVIKTNKYLANPETRARLVFRSAQSSSAVEGIRVQIDRERLLAALRESDAVVRVVGPRVKRPASPGQPRPKTPR